MYLKAIELHGFKSFPEKTKIEFDSGMTVIVGPNGSGKSNISDAVRWVLGETRPSQLRGSGKMEDVIFGGTTKRNPMGFASVSLVLDNADRHFDFEADELTVTRKYYRGGDSEYLLNGAKVRLRDIQELFFDTGLGKNGYSIVSQGKVNEIVTAKPENRREIFEEASGIAKFRFRKNEAEKRLETAGENINRLSDILTGLEERVGPLEKESKKAREFLELSRQKKKLEISLWLDTVDKSKERIKKQQDNLKTLTADYDSVSERLEQKEKYTEERYLYANSLIAKSEENTNAIRETEKSIARLQSEIAVLESERAFGERQIANLKNELAAFDSDGTNTADDRINSEKAVSEYEKAISEKNKRQAVLQVKSDRLLAEAEKNGDEKGRLTGELNGIYLSVQDAKIDIKSLETRSETVSRQADAVRVGIENAEKFLADTQRSAKEVADFISAAEENITRAGNIKKGLLMKKASADEKYTRAAAKRDENIRLQNQTADRIRMLTDFENRMDGYSNAVKDVLKKSKEGALGGILGSVAQIITVKKGYETAVETALGGALQNIVVQNETSAKRAIEYLKKSKIGRVTFYPLDTVRPSNFSENLPDWAQTADRVVNRDEKYKNVVSNLLGRVIITDNLNSASALAKKLSYRYRIVTLDGRVINAGGSFTGGRVNKSTGLFTRKTEIDSLKAKLSSLKTDSEKLSADKEEAKRAADAIRVQTEDCDNEISALSAEKSSARVEYARLSQAAQNYADSIADMKKSLSDYRRTISQNTQKKLRLLDNISELQTSAGEIEKKIDSLDAKDARSVRAQTKLADEIRQLKIEAVALTGKLELEKSKLARIISEMENREERRMEILGSIARYEGEINAKKLQTAKKDNRIKQLREEISAKEKENSDIVAERMEIERERAKLNAESKELTRQRDSLYTKAVKLQERIASMETSYDDIIAKLWENYELTVRNAREFAIEFTDESAVRRELTSVRAAIKKLGSVYVGAIEEYKEVSEKYNFLKRQYDDLAESRAQLVKLIASLDSEMKKLFTDSFAVINENFGRIFTELFGGGTARLELTDEENVLTSGIEIIVSPPGKVIKSLTALSGGEQSLVAIAIYFAILAHNPSPFCVLDEIEAALDDVNVNRYARYVHRISDRTQFIVITHRRGTMEAADVLYGVTMQEDGISKLLKLDIQNLSPSILN